MFLVPGAFDYSHSNCLSSRWPHVHSVFMHQAISYVIYRYFLTPWQSPKIILCNTVLFWIWLRGSTDTPLFSHGKLFLISLVWKWRTSGQSFLLTVFSYVTSLCDGSMGHGPVPYLVKTGLFSTLFDSPPQWQFDWELVPECQLAADGPIQPL